MKVVIQRVLSAHVSVEADVIGSIQHGLMLLVGIADTDTREDIEYASRKIIHMRIFSDEAGKMNRSLLDVKGSILSVSQFTLLADTKKGNRPSFVHAADAQKGEQLYEYFNELLEDSGVVVEKGRFGADMNVSLVNDGPVTIVLDTKQV